MRGSLSSKIRVSSKFARRLCFKICTRKRERELTKTCLVQAKQYDTRLIFNLPPFPQYQNATTKLNPFTLHRDPKGLLKENPRAQRVILCLLGVVGFLALTAVQPFTSLSSVRGSEWIARSNILGHHSSCLPFSSFPRRSLGRG